jgi:hypothetical protein
MLAPQTQRKGALMKMTYLLHLLNIEDDVQLAHVLEVAVERLHHHLCTAGRVTRWSAPSPSPWTLTRVAGPNPNPNSNPTQT